MKSSRTWPWVVGAAVAGIAVGLLLGRTGQAASGRPVVAGSEPRPVRPPIASNAARPPREAVEPSPPAPRGPGPVPVPAPAAPALAEPVAAARATAPPGPSDEWESIPIDRTFGESLGKFETRKTFATAMRGLDTFLPCVRQWKAPPQLDKVGIETELRLRSEEGALVVEDRVILEGNVSDASLEECVIARSRGQRIEVPGIEPGQRFRIKWGGVAALH